MLGAVLLVDLGQQALRLGELLGHRGLAREDGERGVQGDRQPRRAPLRRAVEVDTGPTLEAPAEVVVPESLCGCAERRAKLALGAARGERLRRLGNEPPGLAAGDGQVHVAERAKDLGVDELRPLHLVKRIVARL